MTFPGLNNLGDFKPSALALIAANAIPLIGVLAWGWNTLDIVALYWVENLVIGLINILKMLSCRGGSGTSPSLTSHSAAKFFFIPFFTVHYFGFCAVHGVFVFALLGSDNPFGPENSPFSPSRVTDVLFAWSMLLAIAGLLSSHLVSFAVNYLGKGEFRSMTIDRLMIAPYGRIVVLHLAILFGAFAIAALGSPTALLVLFVVLKTILDLSLHLRSHLKAGSSPSPFPPPPSM